ncbi:2-iminobutanoate/2-iminopropanoate deaminase [Rhodococcus sp. 27YEA15]|uniref:RidA family protein n=1 Tax=Rhodococcus sp. 27YEA15 TaxID=3156259 RepID=UPI003C7BE3AB
MSQPQRFTVVTPEGAAAPQAPYSPGIRAGDFLFVSGQVGIDVSGQLVADDVTAQARRALGNLEAIVRAAGGRLHDVVKTTVLLADIADFAVVNEIYQDAFAGGILPARTCYAAGTLPIGAKVEIEATVYLG